jgi:hypothetical protein
MAPSEVGRRWGQRHPQGANLGSNGILIKLIKAAHLKLCVARLLRGFGVTWYCRWISGVTWYWVGLTWPSSMAG